MKKNIQAVQMENEMNPDISIVQNELSYKTNSLTQLGWLMWRSSISMLRSPMETRIQAVQTLVLGIVFGLIYLRTTLDQRGVQNINGVLFLLITNASFSNLFGVINTFPAEIPIFLREHNNAMYRVINYYLAKSLVEIPKYIIFPIIFVAIVYWMSGLDEKAEKFLICCAVIVLVSNCAVSFGSFLSTVAPDVNAALALSGPLLVPLMIFSGFFLNDE
jgi:ABC-type multidrug transport system permease subunit